MSTVDNRIVEMTFDNAQFEKGVQTSVRSLEDLKKGLDLEKSSKGLDKLSRSAKDFDMGNLARNVEFLAKRFSNLGIIGMTALQNITNSAVNLGKTFLKSLTIDQVTAGFTKYEQKTASVQTIMAATGKSIDEVSSSLEKLSWFTDETSYNFVDMVSNIGKFTAQGIDLDRSVTAMQGIANWAALSGQGANEASRAMYNLAQAIGVGSVKLMDWKSIENANMGTQEFKNTVIETAKAVGTLNKAGKTKKGTLIDPANFSSSLAEGWFTSEVLLKSLDKYGEYANQVYKIATEEGITAAEAMDRITDSTMSLGEKAFKAAQQAKTFTDVVNATKDAVSSGWMETFELIFGNYEEAVVLWSDLAQQMYEIFAEGGSLRNELLTEWKELGGRDDLIQGLMDALAGLRNIGTAVADAFHDIFPETTVDQILAISSAVKEMGANFKETTRVIFQTQKWRLKETTAPIKEPEEYLGELKRGKKKQSKEEVKKLQEHLDELGYDLGAAGADGIFGPKTEAALKAFQKERQILEDGIYKEDVHANLMTALGYTGGEEVLIESIAEKVNFFGGNMKKVQNIVRGVFAIMGIGVKVFGFFKTVISHVLTLLTPIGNALLTIGSAIGNALVALNSWLESSGFLEEKFKEIVTWLAPFGETVNEAAKSLLKFFGLGEDTGSTNDELMTFSKLWSNIISSLEESGVLDRVSDAVNNVKLAFINAWEGLKTFWEMVKTAFTGGEESGVIDWAGALSSVISFLADAFVGFMNLVAPVINWLPTGFKYLGNAFSWLWPHISGFVSRIPEFFNVIKEFFVGIFQHFKGTKKLEGTLGKVIDFLKTFVDGFVALAMKFWSAIKEFFSPRVAKAEEVTGAIEEVTGVSEKTTTALKSFWDTVKDIFTGAGEFLNKLPVGGILGIIMAALGVMMIVKFVSGIMSITKSVSGIVEALTVFRHGYKPVKSFASEMFKLAAAIALVAGAVWLLGSMSWDELGKAAVSLGIIVALLIGFGLACKKMGEIGINVGGILQLAAAIGILAGIAWLLGKMDMETFWTGLVRLSAIMGVLVLFTRLITNVGRSTIQISGFLGLAFAISILAIMARLLGNMDGAKFLKGLTMMTGIMVVLALFANAISNVGGGTIKLSGFFGLSLAIGILAFIASKLAEMDLLKFLKGLGMLSGIMVAMALFAKSVSKSIGGGIKVASLLIMAVAIGILAGIVVLVGQAKWSTLLKGVLTMVSIMFAFQLVIKAMSKISLKQGIVGIVGLIALAGLMLVFSSALHDIKDIEASKIAAFSGGLAAMMIGLGVFMTLVGRMPFTAILAGVAGLSLTIAAIAGMMAGIDWAIGFDKLGKMIGDFTGAMKSAELAQMTKGLSSFDGFTIDEKGINQALKGAGLIQKFADKLPKKDLIQQVVDFFTGSNFKGFSNDIVWFGIAMNRFVKSMEGITITEELDANIQAAIDIATKISSLTTNLTAVQGDLGTYVFNFWPTKMEAFSKDMEDFVEGIKKLITAMEGVVVASDLPTNVQSMIDAATIINDFAITLPAPYTDLRARSKEWKGPLELFADDMLGFVNGFKLFVASMADLVVGDTDDKTDTIITIAKKLNTFGISLPAVYSDLTSNASTWRGPLSLFAEDMLGFSQGFSDFKTSISGIDITGLSDKTTEVKDIAKIINDFGKTLPAVYTNLEENVKTWDGPLASFGRDMVTFSTSFSDFSNIMSGIEDPDTSGLSTKTENAKSIAEEINGFAKSLPKIEPDVKEKGSTWGSPMQKFASDMIAFSDGFKVFADTMGKITIPETLSTQTAVATEAAGAVNTFVQGLKPLQTEGTEETFASWGDPAIQLRENLILFSGGLKPLADALEGIDSTTFEERTTAALNAVRSVAVFLETLQTDEYNIEKNSSALEKFFKGPTKTESILGQLESLGTSIGTISEGFAKSFDFTDNVEIVKSALMSMVGFLKWLADPGENGIALPSSNYGTPFDTQFEILMGNMLRLSSTLKSFNADVPDTSNLTSIISSLSDFMNSIVALVGTGTEQTSAVEQLTSIIDDLKGLLSGDIEGDAKVDSSAFLDGLDPAEIVAKIGTFATQVSAAMTTASETMAPSTTAFNETGKELGAALGSGVSSDTSGSDAMASMGNSMLSSIRAYVGKFMSVGRDMALGLANGIDKGASRAISAAILLARNALQAAKTELDSSSPSKKFITLGEDSGKGLGIGLESMIRKVSESGKRLGSSALESTANTLSSLSDLLAMDVDTEPVIRPVIDLSNVQAGAKSIDGMLSGRRSFSMAMNSSNNLASSVRMPVKQEVTQNGSNISSTTEQPPINEGLVLTGNNFYVREENDISLIAHELAALTWRGQRAMGAPQR